jgi:predicted dehydrogenase
VTAWTGTASGRYGPIDEFGRGQMWFPDGLVASVWGSWADLANPYQLIISGTEGHAVISDGRLTYRRGADGESAEVTGVRIPADFEHAFELFLDALGGAPSPTLVRASEAATCSGIIEAFYRAAREDRWVAIDGDPPHS